MTFLMARSRGVPLRLLPVVVFSRNPLPHLICDRDRRLGPQDLAESPHRCSRVHDYHGRLDACAPRRSVRRRARDGAVDDTRRRARRRCGGPTDRPSRRCRRRPHDHAARSCRRRGHCRSRTCRSAIRSRGARSGCRRILAGSTSTARARSITWSRSASRLPRTTKRCASCSGCFARAARWAAPQSIRVNAARAGGEPPESRSGDCRGGRAAPAGATTHGRRSRHDASRRSLAEGLAMTAAIPFPRFGDVAHVGHVELLTPRPEESLAFFTSVVGLHETGRSGDSVYLRAWGDYECHTLKLTAHTTSGLGHLGLRVRDQATLERFVARLAEREVSGRWTEDDGARAGLPLRHARRPCRRAVLGDTAVHGDAGGGDGLQESAAALCAAGHRAAPPRPRQHPRA